MSNTFSAWGSTNFYLFEGQPVDVLRSPARGGRAHLRTKELNLSGAERGEALKMLKALSENKEKLGLPVIRTSAPEITEVLNKHVTVNLFMFGGEGVLLIGPLVQSLWSL